MKNIVAMVVLSLAALVAQAQSIGGAPFIAVQGKARAEVAPDIFPLTITLSETSNDAARTQASIEGLAREVVALTQAMGMADRDVLREGSIRLDQNVYIIYTLID